MKHIQKILIALFLVLAVTVSVVANTGSVAHANATKAQSPSDCLAYLIPTLGVGEVLPVVNNANPSLILYFQDFGGAFGVPEQISIAESTDGGQTQTLLGAVQAPYFYSDILLEYINGIPYASVCSDWTVLFWQRD